MRQIQKTHPTKTACHCSEYYEWIRTAKYNPIFAKRKPYEMSRNANHKAPNGKKPEKEE